MKTLNYNLRLEKIVKTKMGKDDRARKRKNSTSSEDSVDSTENERRRDLKERDEFANRLKKKDSETTRKVLEVSDKKGFEEAAKRLKLENEGRDNILPSLRIQSRRKYLEKRKEDKVAELEADILDDEYLFEDSMYVLHLKCKLQLHLKHSTTYSLILHCTL